MNRHSARTFLLITSFVLAGHLGAQSELVFAKLAVKHASALSTTQLKTPSGAGHLQIKADDLLAAMKSGVWPPGAFNVTTLPAGTLAYRVLTDDELRLFVKELEEELLVLETGVAPSVIGFNDPDGSAIAGMPGAALQSEALYAVADILIDRLKEELAQAYFDKMAIKMDTIALFQRSCTATSMRIGVCSLAELMPKTQLIFKESRSHLSPQIGATLKAAFMEDLENFPRAFPEAYEAGIKRVASTACGGTLTDADYVALMGGRLYRGIADGDNWTTVLADLAAAQDLPASWGKRQAVLDLILRLGQSVVDQDGKVPLTRIADLKKDGINSYVFLLLVNKMIAADLVTVGATGTVAAVASNAAIIAEIADEILQLVQGAERLSVPLFPAGETASGKIKRISDDVRTVIEHGDEAVMQLIALLGGTPATDRIPPEFFTYYEAATNLSVALADASYGRASLAALGMLNAALPADVVLDDDIAKLITLAADIAEAEGGEIKEVFEAAILPVGSFRIKQSTTFSVAVNAYTGLSYGLEYLADSANYKNYGGVFAPIGVNLSWSRGSEKNMRESHSLLLSVIDIGTLVSYRFNSEDSVQAAPQVSFDNVFAPGLHYVLGFKNSPISIGAGAQYAPRLRSIVDGAANVMDVDAFRFGMFVAVDIPLFHLSLKRGDYNWTKKKRLEVLKDAAAETDPKKKKELERDAEDLMNW